MSKETYYFSHDSNARNDEKILMLRAEHGWEGYGIYWMLVEMMFESSDSALSLKKLKGIALNSNVVITVLQEVINTAITEELFESDGEYFWSNSLIRRKNKMLNLKKSRSEAGKKAMEKRWGNKKTIENTDSDNSVITELKDSYSDDITKNNKGNKQTKETKERKQQTNREEKPVVDVPDGDTDFEEALKIAKTKEGISNPVGYAKNMIKNGFKAGQEMPSEKPKTGLMVERKYKRCRAFIDDGITLSDYEYEAVEKYEIYHNIDGGECRWKR